MAITSATAFDTHAGVKRLVQAGMPEAQAEALIEVVAKTADMPDVSQLATKAELAGVEGELVYWIVGTGAVSVIAQFAAHFVK
jgi:hypothetical protein